MFDTDIPLSPYAAQTALAIWIVAILIGLYGDKILKYLNSRTGGKVICGNNEYIPREINLSNVGQIYVEAEEATTESLNCMLM